MKHTLLFVPCIVAASLVAEAANEQTTMITGFESMTGIRKTWSTVVADSRLELNAGTALLSQGHHSLKLWARSADTARSYYVGAMAKVKPFDCAKRSVLFDVWTTTRKHTRALYVRFYDGKRRVAASWSNWSFAPRPDGLTTVRLQRGMNLSGMHYEQKAVKSPSTKVHFVEFIMGTRDPKVEFDLIVDNLRLSSFAFGTLSKIERPKKLFIDTPLVVKGRWDVLVVPPPGLRKATLDKLLRPLAALGKQPVPVIDGRAFAAKPRTDRALILLGNVNDNPAVHPFYAHKYCAADALIPGPGGHVVRTIHDPFGTGKNVILLGASDAAGLTRAIESFVGKLTPTLVAKPQIELVLKGEAEKRFGAYQRKQPAKLDSWRQAAQKALASGGPRGVVSRMAQMGDRYLLSGNGVWAEWFKCLAFEYDRWVYDKTRKYGAHEGQWGMDVDFLTYRLLPAWDVLEECPVFTDADRLRITRLLSEFVGVDTYRPARSVLAHGRVRHNHQTFPSLGLFFAGTYFTKYYSGAEALRWLETADACFKVQSRYLKPREDSAGYQWLVPTHTARYSLAKPDGAFFWRGHARRLSRLAVMLTDNLGYHPAFGDASGYTGSPSEVPLLRRAVWAYGDRRFQWILNKKTAARPVVSIADYVSNAPSAEPVDLVGARVFPVGHAVYDEFRKGAKIPHEDTFDKVSFRSSYDPQDEYLLLDGITGTGHGHYDGNAILRLAARGRLWLEDGDYIKSLPKFHNTVMIFRDGQSEKPSYFCRLDRLVDLGAVGFSQSTVPDYVKADWTRTVIWLRRRAFVVFDDVKARENAEYSVRCIWRAMGVPAHDAHSLVVEQQDEALRILNADGAVTMLEDDPVRGKNWRRYKLAPPVVRVLTQARTERLRAGQSAVLTNVLRASSASDAGDLAAEMLSPNSMRFTADGVTTICGLAPMTCEGIATDAAICAFSPDGFGAAETRRVEVGEWALRASRPIHVGFDATSGASIVLTNSPVEIAVDDGPRLQLQPGRHVLNLPTEGYGCAALERAENVEVSFAPARRRDEERPTAGLVERWRYQPRPDELLVTNNKDQFEAVDIGVGVTVTPPPRPTNCFSGKPNRAVALHDGGLLTTETSVMWPVDEAVTLKYDLGQPLDLTKVVIRPWWGSKSSKGQSFLCERVRVFASADGFQRDRRLLWERVETETHPDWGRPLTYSCDMKGNRARWLAIELTPRPGSSIYLAEVEVWADGRTLELPDGARPSVDCLSLATWPDPRHPTHIAVGGSEGSVCLLDPNGCQLWRSVTEGPVWSVALADLDGDGSVELIAGSRDGRIYCFDAAGKQRWTYECQRYHGRSGALVVVMAADLDGDGKMEVIGGADNWHFHALTHDGKFLWRYESVHRSTCGLADDLNGDGKKEVVCGTEYYYATVVNHEGRRLWRQRGGPTMNSVAAGDLDGDGKKEVVFGSASGHIYVAGHKGKPRWQFDAGEEVTSVAAADLDGDGRVEAIAASLNFNVYAFDGNGGMKWRRDLGSPVLRLRTHGSPDGETHVVVGCANGRVSVLDAAGNQTRSASLAGRVLALHPCGEAVLAAAEGSGLVCCEPAP